ncbi:MAG: hypothetical protein LBC84_01175 [Prevotellaceae bacterium]|jgi:hypothetical protein|nr:hypothetical protein [Prevotellaceae bacterium]
MRKFSLLALFTLCFSFSIWAQTKEYQIVEHRVRWMENIYTISRKYKADPNTVLEYNGITASQIRRGVVLLIPVPLEEKEVVSQTDRTQIVDPKGNTDPYKYSCLDYQPSLQTHRVSLVLPFNLDQTPPNSQFIDFYMGFLLAATDLKEEGMSVHLSVFDSERFSDLPALVQSGALQDVEMVVGPVYAQDVVAVANYTQGQNIKIVSPLDRQTDFVANLNSNFFQVNASPYHQQSNLIKILPKNSGTVWLFYENSETDEELVVMTKEILIENRVLFKEFIHKVEKGRDITGQLALTLSQNQTNHVVVASTSEAFVSDLLRSLYIVQTRRNCPVTLYGNARWRSFENVDLNYYHSMNLYLSVNNYVDYQNTDVKRFLSRYRALCRTEPSEYAYQGFDVGSYFLRTLYTRGPRFEYCIEQGLIPADPLQSVFRFDKVGPDGGFVNSQTRIIHYLPNYLIEIVR